MSLMEEALTTDSMELANLAVREKCPGFNLRRLGQLVDIIDEEAPRYILFTTNCWWFAGCCFDRLAYQVGPWRTEFNAIPVDYPNGKMQRQTSQNSVEYCSRRYVRIQQPYRIIAVWVGLKLVAVSPIWLWRVVISMTFLGWGWAIYHWLAVASAWTHVRRRLGHTVENVYLSYIAAELLEVLVYALLTHLWSLALYHVPWKPPTPQSRKPGSWRSSS
jgi:hypothetical protein